MKEVRSLEARSRHHQENQQTAQNTKNSKTALTPSAPERQRVADDARRGTISSSANLPAHILSEQTMFQLVIAFLIIGLIAALLGFGGIAGTAVGLAKVVFVVAIVLLVASLIFGGMRGSFGRRP
jgi:uncharacterized membrane protein YtjA (UPF0391 family)